MENLISSATKAGIPQIHKGAFREVNDRLKKAKQEHVNVWRTLSDTANEMSKDVDLAITKKRLTIVQKISRLLHAKKIDGMNWFERVSWCKTPEQFEGLFISLGLERHEWKNKNWMLQEAHKVKEQGGINASLAHLYKILKRLFGTYDNFLLCMEGRLPIEPIDSVKDAVPYLKKEVQRSKDLDVDGLDTIDALLTKSGYEKNPVIKTIIDKIKNSRVHYQDLVLPSRVLKGVNHPDLELKKKLHGRFENKERLSIDKWTILRDAHHLEPDALGEQINDIVIKIADKFSKSLLRKQTSNDVTSVSWRSVIRECETPEDYLKTFDLLKIPSEINEKCSTSYYSLSDREFNIKYQHAGWKSTTWLRRNGFVALKEAIIEKFGSWDDFMKFLGLESDWNAIFVKCTNANDFIQIFSNLGIPDDTFLSRQKLQEAGYNFVYIFILKDSRFPTWDDFKKFMGKETPESYPSQLAKCSTAEEVHTLFENFGIPYEVWTKTSALQKINPGMWAAISRDNRFNDFDDFLTFANAFRTWPQRIALCTQREMYVQLFEENGIPSEKCTSSKWLIDNGYKGLYKALEQRHGWKKFQAIMRERLPISFSSKEEALGYLRREILELRKKPNWICKYQKTDRIEKREYDEVSKPEYYENNVVVKAVTDFFSNSKRN
jgi:hypothetical protein